MWTSFLNFATRARTLFGFSKTASKPESESISTVLQPTESGDSFWMRVGSIFQGRRLRQLEADLAESREARRLIEGQVMAQRGEIARLASMLETAQENERSLFQMHVNIDTQTRYGFVPFPGAPSIPTELYKAAAEAPVQIESNYVNLQSVRAQRNSEFIASVRRLTAEGN
jgi:hypothetical protein